MKETAAQRTRSPCQRKAPGGFTIVELMVTVAVAAILLGFAIPAYNDFIGQRRMASRANDFIMALNYARSEAVHRAQPVSVQAIAPAANNEWGGGYCVGIGTAPDCNDPNEQLRRFDPILPSPVDDPATGVRLEGLGGFAGVTTLTFTARGTLAFANPTFGSVRLCSADPNANPGRQVDVGPTGRPDLNEVNCP